MIQGHEVQVLLRLVSQECNVGVHPDQFIGEDEPVVLLGEGSKHRQGAYVIPAVVFLIEKNLSVNGRTNDSHIDVENIYGRRGNKWSFGDGEVYIAPDALARCGEGNFRTTTKLLSVGRIFGTFNTLTRRERF